MKSIDEPNIRSRTFFKDDFSKKEPVLTDHQKDVKYGKGEKMKFWTIREIMERNWKRYPNKQSMYWVNLEDVNNAMEFEEDFPSLKEANGMLIDYFLKEVWKRCLDKQKVREIIDKLIPQDKKCADNMILNSTLKKELGI